MRLRAGQAGWLMGVGLLLPGLLVGHPGGADAGPKPARSGSRAQAAREPVAAPCTHVVKKGDSVSTIARRYGVGRQAVITANRLARPEALRLGQPLRIPGCASRPATREAAMASAPAVALDGILLARVGPRRVPTQLHLGLPDLGVRPIDFAWPVLGPVASPFGRRRNSWHAGLDIKAELGVPIMAAAPGVVVFSGWERFYGRLIRIEHDNGFLTLYAHNLQNFVEAGDRVEAGTVIATIGRSGRSTASHLHFEIRRNDTAYDPLHLLPERDVQVARADDTEDPHADEDEDDD